MQSTHDVVVQQVKEGKFESMPTMETTISVPTVPITTATMNVANTDTTTPTSTSITATTTTMRETTVVTSVASMQAIPETTPSDKISLDVIAAAIEKTEKEHFLPVAPVIAIPHTPPSLSSITAEQPAESVQVTTPSMSTSESLNSITTTPEIVSVTHSASQSSARFESDEGTIEQSARPALSPVDIDDENAENIETAEG